MIQSSRENSEVNTATPGAATEHSSQTSAEAELDAGRNHPHLPALLIALRPHHWVKNILLLLPLILAHQVGNWSKLSAGVLAFWSMSICASSVYILNDILDIPSDRRHPTKCRRPFASGRTSIPAGLVLAGFLLLGAFGLALLLPWKFEVLLGLYVVLTTLYSYWLKRRLLLDVMLLAGLYTFRIIAGAVAVDVHLTMWLLAFSMFFFLSLAFAKRYSELIEVEHAGGDSLRGRGYHVSDLRIIEAVGPTSGYLSVLVFCNYLNSDLVKSLYAHPQVLWLVAPLLLYWITRLWFVARRRILHDDPIVYAMRDHVSQLTGLMVILVVLAAWLPGPKWLPF